MAKKKLPKPFTAEQMAEFERALAHRFRVKQRQAFKRGQLQRARERAYFNFVFGDILG